ncbi:MAG: selenium cofactor biosynthesis protein YqeC [Eubacteriales bacterium]|nr:selenium cofactor biosynthesis protein YqeC [Eubacteriales bacterium]
MVITFVGSGGKTTSIFTLAARLHRQGKTVLITTTAHMHMPAAFAAAGRVLPFYKDRYCCFTGSLSQILFQLGRDRICIAGLPSPKYPLQKFTGLSAALYEQVCSHADVILVEGDGSRGLPLKYPAVHEPVIPHNTDKILILCGLSALGKPLGEVTFRLSLALDCLNRHFSGNPPITADTLVTLPIIQTLYTEGYLTPLHQRFPNIPVYMEYTNIS